MADASVDIVFKARGLTQAERNTKKLARAVDDVEDEVKQLKRAEDMAAKQWLRNEDLKQKALYRTRLELNKANRDQARIAKQQFFQSSAKIGGAGGSTLGAIGEGIGMGGPIGALGAAAGVAALGLVAFNAHIQRVAESMRRVDNAQKAYNDTLKSAKSAQSAAAFGSVDSSSVRSARRYLNDRQFNQFKSSFAMESTAGQSAMAKAAKAGIAQQIGVSDLGELFRSGQSIGLNPDEILSNLTGMGTRGISRAMQKGTLRRRALGFKPGEDVHAILNQAGAYSNTDQLIKQLTYADNLRSEGARRGIQALESGEPVRIMRKEQMLFWDAEKQAKEALLKSAEEEIKEKQRLAKASGALADIFWRLVPFAETHTQELIRAKQDIKEALDTIQSGGLPR